MVERCPSSALRRDETSPPALGGGGKGSTIRTSSFSARQKATFITKLVSNKKAEDIVVLDMRKIVNFCDYFVLCSGNSDRQVRAIALGVEEGLEEAGFKKYLKEGFKDSSWIVFDCGDVVVHIFYKEAREFYGLEHLWHEAKNVELEK